MILAITFAFAALVALFGFALRLSIYALPLWIGIAVGFAVIQHGGHPALGAMAAFAAACAVFALAKMVLTATRSSALSTVILAAFALAAFVAGWQTFAAFAQVFDLEEARMWLAPFGASVIAALAISRLRRPAV